MSCCKIELKFLKPKPKEKPVMVVNEKTVVVKRKNFVRSTVMLSYSVVTVKHSEENKLAIFEEKEMGNVMLGLTVLPYELSDSLGAFITIAEVWLDNKKLKHFIKQTIELSVYQEGDIKLLFNGSIEAGTFKTVTLVLDNHTDESGEFPGCYTLNEDNHKVQINSFGSLSKIELNKKINVYPQKTTEAIFQVDLEKVLAYNLQPANNHSWNAENVVDQAAPVKVVLKDECGIVKGEIHRLNCTECEIYVLAFKKGNIEMLDNCFDPEQFPILVKNATAGSKVKPYGGFQLSLLEAGEYEFHLVSLNKKYNRVFRFKGMINPSSNIQGIMLKNIKVLAQSQIQLNIDIIGVI